MTTKTGIQVTALMRAYLNLAGIPWKECEKLGKEFNAQIESAAWLDTDTGLTFDLSFSPVKIVDLTGQLAIEPPDIKELPISR